MSPIITANKEYHTQEDREEEQLQVANGRFWYVACSWELWQHSQCFPVSKYYKTISLACTLSLFLAYKEGMNTILPRVVANPNDRCTQSQVDAPPLPAVSLQMTFYTIPKHTTALKFIFFLYTCFFSSFEKYSPHVRWCNLILLQLSLSIPLLSLLMVCFCLCQSCVCHQLNFCHWLWFFVVSVVVAPISSTLNSNAMNTSSNPK